MRRAHSHVLRRGRFSELGRLYLLTTVIHQRRPLLLDFTYARLVIDHLRQADLEQVCTSLAWVVMPDHLHWLIRLDAATLDTLMRRFKSRSSRALHRAGAGSGPIWQPGYQDRALRNEESVQRIARYIVANPLRAGLVDKIGNYPHWDAAWL